MGSLFNPDTSFCPKEFKYIEGIPINMTINRTKIIFCFLFMYYITMLKE